MVRRNLDQFGASVRPPSQAADLHYNGLRSSCPGCGSACCTCEKLDSVDVLNKPHGDHGSHLSKGNASTWFSKLKVRNQTVGRKMKKCNKGEDKLLIPSVLI